jgi:hypothetical protein
MDPNVNILGSTKKLFQYYKSLADKTFEQLNDSDIDYRPNEASNSIGIIVHHLVGNMLSRFTDFKTSDGEKPWRNREAEFEAGYASKKEMISAWENGWRVLFDALDSVKEDDLGQIIYIRNEGHTIFEALQRQLAHYSGHIGQIIYIGKSVKGPEFRSLSIPKGGSDAFNKEKFSAQKSKQHFTDKAE